VYAVADLQFSRHYYQFGQEHQLLLTLAHVQRPGEAVSRP
jgi:hypothetical protein